ncbi:flagellar basal-body MS-ring/collar protein FliF [Metaclostridioides mangenotii]|uniref:flagellar basal-body MS-ring/collar protein FliF n=1 Tax=Metaclostridioides mangenotii TaxID=1540 RepID=UPI0026EAA2CE|nr:flagellar basal-body MS-ring/collar protein FliF [Clostridioides mangenotii]
MKVSVKDIKKQKIDPLIQKFKSSKKGVKIAIFTSALTVLLAVVFTIGYINKNKYDVLFSDIDAQDAAEIVENLESDGVKTKIKGNTVYVPKNQVDKLRLELAPEFSNGSKGFELMDEGSSMGLTDEEFRLKKQRMLQGEIEKTIKSFPQVDGARVHITPGTKSVFEKESEPGKAAVYIILKKGTDLDENQVKSIVSLVSGSVDNMAKENVEVIDDKMNLLSEGLFFAGASKNKTGVNTNIKEAKEAESALNLELEKSILNMLEPIFGKGKVKATVSADLNFDSVEQTEIKIDPNKVAIKETKMKNTSQGGVNNAGLVDDNMTNAVNNYTNNKDESLEESYEYETGKTETHTIKAPGEVKRLTTSIVIDGKVKKAVLFDVEDIVYNAIGLDKKRGDDLFVTSMDFDPEGKAEAKKEIEEIKAQELKAKLLALGIFIVTSLIVLAAVYFLVIRKNKKQSEDEYDEDYDANLIDSESQSTFDETVGRANRIVDGEDLSLEDEVRLYASDKPDQVTEIIKTWLNE